MELRAGYKQTEVGVIPQDWRAESLGSLTTLMTNGFVGTATSAYVSSDDGVLYVQGYNVEPNGFNFHGIKRVNRNFHKLHQKSCLKKGDLLTIQTGDIGVTTLVPPELEGANCHALVISRFDPKRSRSEFYCHYFNSEIGRAAFKEIETGTTMKHLNVGDMVQLLVPSPPLAEQRAIATALSDVDTLLAKIDQLIAKKRDLKQAAMQQLLTGQIRLPGFSGEWEVKRLGDVLERIVGGGTPSRSNPNYWGGDIPWVTVKDFATFDPIQAQESITYAGLKSSASNLIPKGTLITSTRMALGRAVIYEVDVTINQDLKALFPKRFLHTKFLYYWFEQNAEAIDDLGSGSTVKGISLSDLRAIPFHLASLSEQTAIATVLSDMDAELAALEARRDKTRALKQGMMQALLTGRIRLAGAD